MLQRVLGTRQQFHDLEAATTKQAFYLNYGASQLTCWVYQQVQVALFQEHATQDQTTASVRPAFGALHPPNDVSSLHDIAC